MHDTYTHRYTDECCYGFPFMSAFMSAGGSIVVCAWVAHITAEDCNLDKGLQLVRWAGDREMGVQSCRPVMFQLATDAY